MAGDKNRLFTANLPGGEGQIRLPLLLRLCDNVAPIVLVLCASVRKADFIWLHIMNSKHF